MTRVFECLPNPINEIKVFCGEDLEKWMLKTACSYIEAEQIYSGDKKVECRMQDIYVDILFKNKQFPDGWGLYVDASPATKIQHHNYLNITFIIRGDALKIMKLILNGLTFYLLVDSPATIKQGIIYRPRGIEIKRNNIKKVLEICWQDSKYSQGLFMNYERDINRTNEEWENIIFNKKGSS